MNYYYWIDGAEVRGPYPSTEILADLRRGALPNTTKVCAEGQQDWHPIHSLLPPQPPTPQATREQQIVSLRCVSCGAALDITIDMDVFACAYCGTQQIVKRIGGSVSLKLVRESIARVQRGTDRTAAELAIQRINQELAGMPKERKRRRGEIIAQENKKGCWPFLVIFGVIAVGPMMAPFFPGNEVFVISTAVIAGVVYGWIADAKLRQQTEDTVALGLRDFDARASELQAQLERYRRSLEADDS